MAFMADCEFRKTSDKPDKAAIKDVYSYNSAGGGIVLGNPSPGNYSLTFEGLGKTELARNGNAQVSAYGGNGSYCSLTNYGVSGSDYIASFRCFEPGGKLVNTAFSIWVMK